MSVCAYVLVLVLCPVASAVPPQLQISQLYHTQWTPREGAPGDISTLAQTKDGYLWIGTTSGLFRFDGVRFERVESVGGRNLLSDSIYTVAAASDGGLWVGHVFGGATFIKDGELRNYGEAEGLPRTSLLRFAQDGSGAVWAGTQLGFFRLSGGKWSLAGDDWSLPQGSVTRASLDGQGTLWVQVGQRIVFLRRGSHGFEDSGITVPGGWQESQLENAPDGTVWLSYGTRDNVVTLRDLNRRRTVTLRLELAPDVQPRRTSLIDTHGQFWFTTESGAGRIALPESGVRELRWSESRSGPLVRLTGSSFALIEDREGNVWVGSSDGLDRFRAPAFAKALSGGAQYYPIAPAPDGSIWSGATAPDVFRLSTASPPERIAGLPTSSVLTTFYRDPHDELWVGSQNTIWNLQAGRWRPLERPLAVRIAPSNGEVQSMAMDATGAMWVSMVREGVYRVQDNAWTPFGGRDDLPREPATIITADDAGGVWFGYVGNRLRLLRDNQLTAYSKDDGLDVGVVLAIAPGADVWVGGEGGLARFDGRRFYTMHRSGGKPFPGISGIARMPEGDLWLGSGEGAIHITAEEIRRVRADPRHELSYTMLDYLDGLPGIPHAIRPLPSVVTTGEGRVWFTSRSGVAWTDPILRSRNPVVPTVLVRQVEADGTQRDVSPLTAPLPLRPRVKNLRISYTALSLTMPERVYFKYRLEGRDSQWQDAGTRREAFYTDLEPGAYRFRVIASNNDGVWNEEGAQVEFVIPPTFTQTRWFTALWVAAALGLMLLIFAWWLRQAQAQLRSRLEGRLTERERIARELHDTFLQAVQGLVLRFQSATQHIPPQEPSRKLMEEALNRADRVIADGRDAIMSLRTSAAAEGTDLGQALRSLGEELARDSGVAFEVLAEETPRSLHPIVREEVYRIAAEAISNAFRHAGAKRITVRVGNDRRGLILQVSDDGCGFDSGVDRESDGHWGLKGMGERAARVKGKLEIKSRAGAGTHVELSVPKDIAYAGNGSWYAMNKIAD